MDVLVVSDQVDALPKASGPAAAVRQRMAAKGMQMEDLGGWMM